MAVVVFDSDVLIEFSTSTTPITPTLSRSFGNRSLPAPGEMLSAVNDCEILIGPITAGKDARDHVEAMLASFSIEIMIVDGACARRAAAVRARTDLELPDAYALATAIHAEHNGHDDVRLTSFDKAVLRAHADLHPN